jgi:hypothetical protein
MQVSWCEEVHDLRNLNFLQQIWHLLRSSSSTLWPAMQTQSYWCKIHSKSRHACTLSTISWWNPARTLYTSAITCICPHASLHCSAFISHRRTSQLMHRAEWDGKRCFHGSYGQYCTTTRYVLSTRQHGIGGHPCGRGDTVTFLPILGTVFLLHTCISDKLSRDHSPMFLKLSWLSRLRAALIVGLGRGGARQIIPHNFFYLRIPNSCEICCN